MDLAFNFSNINWLAVLVAAVSAFVIAGCWYSPLLFGRFLPNLTAIGESAVARHLGVSFLVSFALLWLSAAFFAGLLGPETAPRQGIDIGLAIGLFFVFPAHTIAAIFGARPVRIMFINGAYFMICFAVMGAILGAWH